MDAVDSAFRDALVRGAAALGLELRAPASDLLERYADRLLAWNRKVNLTAITAPAEVAEKHVLDSLLVARSLAGAQSLLDVGSGAGLPGIPLACVRPELEVVCCDSVAKKVAFVKAVAAELDLRRVRGVVARASGSPEREGLPRAAAVVSRAVADPETWVPLGKAYLAPGGSLLAMLGRLDDESTLRDVGAANGLSLAGVERYELPFSRSARAVARWVER
jgi:16S rRNA (guanine527-N7)-methyltransferase